MILAMLPVSFLTLSHITQDHKKVIVLIEIYNMGGAFRVITHKKAKLLSI